MIDGCFPMAEMESYANALSARTRSLNGSAFCENRACAWRVFAWINLVHQSCRANGDGAKRVYVSCPRCLTLNGYNSFPSESIGACDPSRGALAADELEWMCSSPGRSLPLVVTLASLVSETDVVVLPRGAVMPFCLITASSVLSRNNSGIGIG